MVQVFFVMLFFPVVMNALQYYIIDSFIKDQKPSNQDHNPSEDGDEDSIDGHGRTRRRRSRGEDQDSAHAADAENETTKGGAEIQVSQGQDKPTLKVEPRKLDEYDPTIDGEGSGGSGEYDNPPDPPKEAKARLQRSHVHES